jgi:hypothetical protein
MPGDDCHAVSLRGTDDPVLTYTSAQMRIISGTSQMRMKPSVARGLSMSANSAEWELNSDKSGWLNLGEGHYE